LPFAEPVKQLKRQRQWLIDLEHLLDPALHSDQSPPKSQRVAQTVADYLDRLIKTVMAQDDLQDQLVARHIQQTFYSHWSGLFQCYDVPGLPRTNNELEQYMRQIKTGQRRITGRKNVQDLLLRYGRYVTCIDQQESLSDLLSRLLLVTHDTFLHERQALTMILQREQKRFRFRRRRQIYLVDLEKQWSAAVAQKKPGF
jgi:hypothetical protein